MKYKRIKGVLHDFAHSFMYGLHYVKNETDRTIDELAALVESGRYEFVSIDFLNDKYEPDIFSDAVYDLIANYRKSLITLLNANGIEEDRLKNWIFYIALNEGTLTFKMQTTDDRDLLHEYYV